MSDVATTSAAEDDMTAVEPKIVWPLADTTTKELLATKALKLNEDCAAYHPEVAVVTEEYRGQDMWPRRTFNCGNSNQFTIDRQAVLSFGPNLVFGSFWTESKDITARFNMQTQCPHLEIILWKGTGGNNSTAIRCRIFGNALSSSPDALDVRSQSEFTQSDQELLRRSSPAEESPTDTPFVTQLHIDSQTEQDNTSPYVFERSQVNFIGVDKEEVMAMVQQYKEADPTARWWMPREHKIVALLACQGANLTVLQRYKSFAKLQLLRSCFISTMKMSRDHGLFWFYRLQKPDHMDIPMASNNFPICGFHIPRWLVQSWWVAEQGGSDPYIVSATWASFTVPDQFPFPDLVMFLWRLGVQREREHQQQRIIMGPLSDNRIATAEFIRCERATNQFMVLVWIPADYLDSESDLIPQVDSRVSISVTDSHGHLAECRGFVTENLHVRKANFSVFVTVNGSCSFEDLQSYPIFIHEVDDEIPSLRQLNALEAVANSPSNNSVDFKSTLGLATHPDAHSATGLKEWFDADSTRKERFLAVLKGGCLNPLQAKAMKSMLDRSMVLLGGPAGTGKTRTLAATVEGLVAAGLRVLVVTTNNSPLDTVFDHFYKHLKTGHDKYCLFRGGRLRGARVNRLENDNPDATSSSDVQEEQSEEQQVLQQYQKLISDMWDNFFGTNADANIRLEQHTYQVMLREMIKKIGNWPQHSLYEKAHQYCRDLKELEEPSELSTEQIGALERAIRQVEDDEAFRAEFFSGKDSVAVMFTTTTRSAHEILTSGGFRPDVLVMDEASQTSIPEGCIPVTAHPDIKAVIVAGDAQQQTPFLRSRRSNEMATYMSKSVLDAFKGLDHVEQIMLRDCYRMHPHIMQFPSQAFYRDSLTCRATVDDELGASLAAIFGSIADGVLSARRRIAVDVSTTPQKNRVVYSEMFENTTSSYNEFEADAIIATIKKLLAFRPSSDSSHAPARRIEPGEIMVVTPYSGQRRVIIRRLYRTVPEACGHIRVLTTTQAPSSEANIVLFSMVSNRAHDELDVDFIARPNPLNVALTRAREALILFGNFGGWTRAWLRSGDEARLIARSSAFKHLILDLVSRKDVIDVDDYLAALEGIEVRKSLFQERTVGGQGGGRGGGWGGRGGGRGRRGGRRGRGG